MQIIKSQEEELQQKEAIIQSSSKDKDIRNSQLQLTRESLLELPLLR